MDQCKHVDSFVGLSVHQDEVDEPSRIFFGQFVEEGLRVDIALAHEGQRKQLLVLFLDGEHLIVPNILDCIEALLDLGVILEKGADPPLSGLLNHDQPSKLAVESVLEGNQPVDELAVDIKEVNVLDVHHYEAVPLIFFTQHFLFESLVEVAETNTPEEDIGLEELRKLVVSVFPCHFPFHEIP